MGKRKDFDYDSGTGADDDSSVSSTVVKKSARKPKKNKQKIYDYDDSESIDVVNDGPSASASPSTPIRTVDKAKLSASIMSASKTTPLSTAKSSATKKKKGRGRESGTSSGEERWLDAIESGKLEEVDDELKKIKDPKLMTARQRAMYERGNDKETIPGAEMLMSLPTGYKEKVLTAEAIEKAQLKSAKRKQLADEKREKDKKRTMERLLKKQETKQRSMGKKLVLRVVEPTISYRNTVDGSTLSFPLGYELIEAQTEKEPPKPITCSIEGCTNLKKYNCSKTNVPLCSLNCYNKIVRTIKTEIMC